MIFLDDIQVLENENKKCIERIERIEKLGKNKNVHEIVNNFFNESINIKEFIEKVQNDEEIKNFENSSLVKGEPDVKNLDINELVKAEMKLKQEDLSKFGTDKLHSYSNALKNKIKKINETTTKLETKRNTFNGIKDNVDYLYNTINGDRANLENALKRGIISLNSMDEISKIKVEELGELAGRYLSDKKNENPQMTPEELKSNINEKVKTIDNFLKAIENSPKMAQEDISEDNKVKGKIRIYLDKLDSILSDLNGAVNKLKQANKAEVDIISKNITKLENAISSLNERRKREENDIENYLKRTYGNEKKSADDKIKNMNTLFGSIKKYGFFKDDNGITEYKYGAVNLAKDEKLKNVIDEITKYMEESKEFLKDDIFEDLVSKNNKNSEDEEEESTNSDWEYEDDKIPSCTSTKQRKSLDEKIESLTKEVTNIKESVEKFDNKNDETYKKITENSGKALKFLKDIKESLSNSVVKPSKKAVKAEYGLRNDTEYGQTYNSIKDENKKKEILRLSEKIIGDYKEDGDNSGLKDTIKKFLSELGIDNPEGQATVCMWPLSNKEYDSGKYSEFDGKVEEFEKKLKILKLNLVKLKNEHMELDVKNVNFKDLDDGMVKNFGEIQGIELNLKELKPKSKINILAGLNLHKDDTSKDNISDEEVIPEVKIDPAEQEIVEEYAEKTKLESKLEESQKRLEENDVYKKDQLEALYKGLLTAKNELIGVSSSKQNPTGLAVDSKKGVIKCLEEHVIGRKKSFFKRNFVASTSNSLARNIIDILNEIAKLNNKKIKDLVKDSEIDETKIKKVKKQIKNYVKRSDETLQQKDLKHIKAYI